MYRRFQFTGPESTTSLTNILDDPRIIYPPNQVENASYGRIPSHVILPFRFVRSIEPIQPCVEYFPVRCTTGTCVSVNGKENVTCHLTTIRKTRTDPEAAVQFKCANIAWLLDRRQKRRLDIKNVV